MTVETSNPSVAITSAVELHGLHTAAFDLYLVLCDFTLKDYFNWLFTAVLADAKTT